MLMKADASLANVLDSISSGLPCTFIYLTTPATNVAVQKQGEEQVYKPEFKEPLHMDLKRDVYARARNESGVPQDLRPLFEKYQFFSPGTFSPLSLQWQNVVQSSCGVSLSMGNDAN